MVVFAQVDVSTVQTYWNNRPCNVRHSQKPVGTQAYYDEVERRKYYVEPHIPGFADFGAWNGKRVLEIGCGIGTDTINFARHGAHVTAVDLSETSLDIARQRAHVYGLADRINFIHADAEHLSDALHDKQYDLVYSFGVLHHTPNPEKAFDQAIGYLTPGGTLKLMLYNRHSWKVFWIVLAFGRGQFWKLSQLVARFSEAQTGCPVTYTYTKKEVRALLRKRGVEAQDIFVDHVFPYDIEKYIRYQYRVVWYFRWLPRNVFRLFERRLGWHICVTAKLP